MEYGHNSFCRICKGRELTKFLSLGNMPPVDSFVSKEMILTEKKYPLDVYFCHNCKLVQLLDVVPKEVLFNKSYAYFSSASLPLVRHFEMYASEIKKRFLKEGDLVVEIGSNDGVLLQFFKEKFRVLGIEPSENVAEVARSKGIDTLCEFFNEELCKSIVKKYGRAKIITANNVFAHIDNLDEIIRSIEILLGDDGVFVFEAHYLFDLIEKKEFDTIYHEHLCYFSVRPLIELFKRFDMKVFDAERVDVHGGSIRVFVSKNSAMPMSDSVSSLIDLEEHAGLYGLDRFVGFQKGVENIREKLVNLVRSLNSSGKTVVGYGAPAKSGTLLNFCGFTEKDLKYITDTTPHKIGLLTPGTHIPVVSPEILKSRAPDYILMLAWNYKNFILEKESEIRKIGTKFIIPIPEVEVV
ncbi:MAG TPA: class I SAM-dependent methyltransferase [archaeon]|nr:class I SAM-dependent methyltransferase [archaeon]